MALVRTSQLRAELERCLPERPFEVEFWDGSRLPSTTGNGVPRFRVRSPQAVAHVLRAPGQLGLGRAYVSGELEVDDIDAMIGLLDTWQPSRVPLADRVRLGLSAARACGPRLPRPPMMELRPRGRRHSRERDARAVRHHYDLPAEFYALFLDRSMTYSCGLFSHGAQTLEHAQEQKLELVCAKLGLEPGQRVLDVGCGWGSFAVHAAGRHRARVTGITLSAPQAAVARRRAQQAGLEQRVEIREIDYRELVGERFDAIASIGMVEHVGAANIDAYAGRLASLLRPGGRLLNQGIARLRHGDPEAGPFSERYVFPDAAPLHVSRVLAALEAAGLQTVQIEGFGQDYAETLRHWAQRLDNNLDEATRLAGAERVRVWRVYLRAARRGFETGFTSVYQVLCTSS
jgi:cyclopropane-fatty-acyl-phospholipid synthase